jgi:hypothetical protein
MKGVTPQALAIDELFNHPGLKEIFYQQLDFCSFYVYCKNDALWIMAEWTNGARVAFRAVYAPHDTITVSKTVKKKNYACCHLQTTAAAYTVTLDLYPGSTPGFRCQTTVTPREALLFSRWPRDITALKRTGEKGIAEGEVYFAQQGLQTGMIYFGVNEPASGAMLYLQNLSSLNNYCEQTKTSAGHTVGGHWPDIGFALPAPAEETLPAGEPCVISDMFVHVSPQRPASETEQALQFMELLAAIYQHLPRPGTRYHHWPHILEKTRHDLVRGAGNWCQVGGKPYLNAYVCDYKTPPELMVQLAVLLPLRDYEQWSHQKMTVVEDLLGILPEFYDEKQATFVRWLPAAQHRLSMEEEHKHPLIMDSWYLHHPLLNLLRLLKQGYEEVREQLLSSLDFAIKVAHHFQYQWPVFYKIDTLEVVKAETAPGKGGEKDVGGLYAEVMVSAWELTGEEKYLEEAKAGCLSLRQKGFTLLYQANNTAFSACAALRLYQVTKEERFLEVSYRCIANLFKNMWIWECDYGYAKHYSTFFAVFPLQDAPYTAVYEEAECFSALHRYLQLAATTDLPPAFRILLPEFIRYYLHRAVYYYPPALPEACLAKEIKTGELAKNMWIPVEDLRDGWEQTGSVGQEVYGAGLCFSLVPRHYCPIPDTSLMLFSDYPIAGFAQSSKKISFRLTGHKSMSCELRIIPQHQDDPMPSFEVSAGKTTIAGNRRENGHLLFRLPGDQQVSISWT